MKHSIGMEITLSWGLPIGFSKNLYLTSLVPGLLIPTRFPFTVRYLLKTNRGTQIYFDMCLIWSVNHSLLNSLLF